LPGSLYSAHSPGSEKRREEKRREEKRREEKRREEKRREEKRRCTAPIHLAQRREEKRREEKRREEKRREEKRREEKRREEKIREEKRREDKRREEKRREEKRREEKRREEKREKKKKKKKKKRDERDRRLQRLFARPLLWALFFLKELTLPPLFQPRTDWRERRGVARSPCFADRHVGRLPPTRLVPGRCRVGDPQAQRRLGCGHHGCQPHHRHLCGGRGGGDAGARGAGCPRTGAN
jgi:hypothetical protein